MPILPTGKVIGISNERARLHATRLKLRVSKETPFQQLFQLVDIIVADPSDPADTWDDTYRFSGHTLSNQSWIDNWDRRDREYFLQWLDDKSQVAEIEGARSRILYDELPHELIKYPYPELLFSMLKQQITALPLKRAQARQWRNTILNLRGSGIREEEIFWSGIINFLDQFQEQPATVIEKETILSNISFAGIKMTLTNELCRDESPVIHFDDRVRRLSLDECEKANLLVADGEIAVQRYVSSLLNYRVGYIRDNKRLQNPNERLWFLLNPFGKLILNNNNQYYSDIDTAFSAASHDARKHYALRKSPQLNNKYEFSSLAGGWKYREWLITLPDYPRSQFTAHFTERNVLAHLRTKNRFDNNGHKLLFIEELQSDWHQAAARYGYHNRWPGRIQVAPFRKEWVALALKMMVFHAIKYDYAGIAWADGSILSRRYNALSESIRRIYDKEIPRYLVKLSESWHGQIIRTVIETRDPGWCVKRSGDYWSVSNSAGSFSTRYRFCKDEAIAIAERHSKQVNLSVPVFMIPDGLREFVAKNGLPLFGELICSRSAQ
ncbi:MAG: hypothetical protein ACE5EH_12590 [Gammaproteobacteria bacterium]